jgi:hypothetical protein
MENNQLAQLGNRPMPMVLGEDFKKKLTDFVTALNVEPTAEELKERDGRQYVPIEIVERKLNQFFNGLWETYEFKYQVIVNELVGSLILSVYHPDAGVWLRRSGTGAVLIQQKAVYEPDGKGGQTKKKTDVLDVSLKIANTLEKDMGHLKADCIKNAAKSWGRSFGSALLRNVEDGDVLFISHETVEKDITVFSTKKELKDYFKTLPKHVINDKRVKNVLKRKEIELENPKQLEQ